MNTSAVVLVIVVFVVVSVVHGEHESSYKGPFTKEAILELDEILVATNIMKPDKERINKDLKTLIQEAIYDLEVYVKDASDTDERQLCLITIKTLDEELEKLNEDGNYGQEGDSNSSVDTTTATSDTLTISSDASTIASDIPNVID